MTDTRYSIAEAARIHEATLRTLRFYEQKGLVRPTREGSRRWYSDADMERLRIVFKWARAGLPLEKIKIALEYMDSGNAVALTTFVKVSFWRIKRDVTQQRERVIAIMEEPVP